MSRSLQNGPISLKKPLETRRIYMKEIHKSDTHISIATYIHAMSDCVTKPTQQTNIFEKSSSNETHMFGKKSTKVTHTYIKSDTFIKSDPFK